MIVAPNPIDFRKALAGFADAFQSGNVVVMFTIITSLMLYLVLAIWARTVDKRDARQVGKLTLISCNWLWPSSLNIENHTNQELVKSRRGHIRVRYK